VCEQLEHIVIGLCADGAVVWLVAVLEWGDLDVVVVVRRVVRVIERWGWCSRVLFGRPFSRGSVLSCFLCLFWFPFSGLWYYSTNLLLFTSLLSFLAGYPPSLVLDREQFGLLAYALLVQFVEFGWGDPKLGDRVGHRFGECGGC